MEKISKNIFLIGMMGSWKSTVGKKIAKSLNYNFIDTDDYIEDLFGMSISQIFETKGENEFRKIESRVFIEKCKEKKHLIATGGGIVIKRENREALKNDGITLLLKAKPETLSIRIKNTNKRPLLNGNDSLFRLSQIWKKRKIYYENAAHITIETDKFSSNQVAKMVIKELDSKYAIN